MSIAMGTRLHINLYIYKTTSVPILVLLSQNAQSDEKVILSRCRPLLLLLKRIMLRVIRVGLIKESKLCFRLVVFLLFYHE